MQGLSEFAQFQGLEAILTHLIPLWRRLEVVWQVSIWGEIATQYQIETGRTESKNIFASIPATRLSVTKYFN